MEILLTPIQSVFSRLSFYLSSMYSVSESKKNKFWFLGPIKIIF